MSTKKTRYKVHVNGGQHQFVTASNAFNAAKKASGEKVLKKVEPEKNDPAGYNFTTYANDNATVKVIEG